MSALFGTKEGQDIEYYVPKFTQTTYHLVSSCEVRDRSANLLRDGVVTRHRGRNRKWISNSEPINEARSKNSGRKCNQQISLAGKTASDWSFRQIFRPFIPSIATARKQILLDKSHWVELCPLLENRKHSFCSAVLNDSKMPKLKGVEATKSHKKIRRKRTSASAVKGKSKLGNKGKKVSHDCNLSEHFDLLRQYDSNIFSDFSEFCVGRSSSLLSYQRWHIFWSYTLLHFYFTSTIFYTALKQHFPKNSYLF